MNKISSKAVRRQITTLIPVYMNKFMVGCCRGWTANAIYFFLQGNVVHATLLQCFSIASFSEIGKIVFAIPAGILTDKYGRKTIIVSIAFIHFFSWILLSTNVSLIAIYIARFVLGIAAALENTTGTIFIGEIASPEIRGKLISIHMVSYTTGIIVPSIITALFSSYNMLSYGITLFSFIGFLSLFWITETPNYLISVSKYEQAKKNLKHIRLGYSENEINIEFEKSLKYIQEEKKLKDEMKWSVFLKSPAVRRPLMITILLSYFLTALGNFTISAYITTICPPNQFIDIKYYSSIVQGISFLSTICSTFYIDKFSRRGIYMSGAALMIFSNAFCALIHYFYTQYNDDVFKWIFLASNISIFIVQNGSLLPINSAVKSELLPQAVKGFGVSLNVIAQATSTVVSYKMYQLISEYFGLHYVYVMFSINSVALLLLVYYLLPEGQGKCLADVQQECQRKRTPTIDTLDYDSIERKSLTLDNLSHIDAGTRD